jgi:hypothetical protein
MACRRGTGRSPKVVWATQHVRLSDISDAELVIGLLLLMAMSLRKCVLNGVSHTHNKPNIHSQSN